MNKALLSTISFAVFFLFSVTWSLGDQASMYRVAVDVDISAVMAGDDKHNDKNEGKDDENDNKKRDKDDGDKVIICHASAGSSGAAHTIVIPKSALEAHLAHGDSEGMCPSCVCPPNVNSCICADGTPGKAGFINGLNSNSLRSIHGGP